MKLLEDKIISEGKVLEGDILKVDGFLNHRLDVALLSELGKDIFAHFKDKEINLIMTVEASGIGLACMAAMHFGVRVLVAKKHKSANISDGVYTASAYSFTHKVENNIVVSKEYLNSDAKVLIIDDFLATGQATVALVNLVEQAGAKVQGVAVAIEKAHQGGRKSLEEKGLEVYSLACVTSMDKSGVTFAVNK